MWIKLVRISPPRVDQARENDWIMLVRNDMCPRSTTKWGHRALPVAKGDRIVEVARVAREEGGAGKARAGGAAAREAGLEARTAAGDDADDQFALMR
jgi:hypothetical protein